jgi:hypothetical protein
MGTLKQTDKNYYESPSKFGNFQFTSLDDIINQFMVAYVGEEKIISKVKRLDVAFHAQRAMQELSFDTFKSIKSQEIELPPSNTMILPHDYVNYTKISWSDSSGIKHLLHPTSKTSNPFKIKQLDDGGYDFTTFPFENGDFESTFSDSPWQKSPNHGASQGTALGVPENDNSQSIVNGQYEWRHVARTMSGGQTTRHFAIWQTIDVTGIDEITVSAKGLSSAAKTGKTAGVIRVGFSTQIDLAAQDPNNQTYVNADGYNPNMTNPLALATSQVQLIKQSKNMDPNIFDVSTLDSGLNYIEFKAGDDTMSAATILEDVDVSNLTTVDLLIVSSGGTIDSTATLHASSAAVPNATFGINAVDDIVLSFESDAEDIQSDGDSTTWSSYKSATPSENQDDYQDDTYWPNNQKRYGLDPQHAQVNGSFYIDNLNGLINFSSNISGKTVILDYISDSLGTDGEMQVHKFAEEAMYKWISHAVLASRANTPEYLVNRYKKERFAAIRQAKLRLSNIKLEELTQILRGKSKWIKH